MFTTCPHVSLQPLTLPFTVPPASPVGKAQPQYEDISEDEDEADQPLTIDEDRDNGDHEEANNNNEQPAQTEKAETPKENPNPQ